MQLRVWGLACIQKPLSFLSEAELKAGGERKTGWGWRLLSPKSS